MSTDYIPDDVLVNVLLRLPFDSLIRFKCVSKSWCNLINSSYFQEMHCPNPDSRIITRFGTKFYTFELDTVVENGEKEYMAIAKKLRSPADIYGYLPRFAESCNGIIFLSDSFTGDFVLWNPFTGSTLNSQQWTPPYTNPYWPSCVQNAFVYDHLNDDYKFVRWYQNDSLCVYSFKHKSWTTISDARKLGLYRPVNGYFSEYCTFLNGAMHWPLEYDDDTFGNNSILAFDLGTCKFREIPCAPLHAGDHGLQKSLSSLNGCLCLCYTGSFWRDSATCRQRGVDAWLMKEYGVESSWTKIACFDLHDQPGGLELRYMKAVAYSEKRGKLMLEPRSRGRLMMYDFDTESLRDVVIKDDEGEDDFSEIFEYQLEEHYTCWVCVGSFVSPHLLQ